MYFILCLNECQVSDTAKRSNIRFILQWHLANMKETINTKDTMPCQETDRHNWIMFGASAMPQYVVSASEQVSPNFQPSKPSTVKAKTRLEQKESSTSKRTAPRPMETNTLSGQLKSNPAVPTQTNKGSFYIAVGFQNMRSFFLVSFAGTSVAFLVLGTTLALAWFLFSRIRAAYTKTWNKKPGGYERLNGPEQQELVVGGKKFKIALSIGNKSDCEIISSLRVEIWVKNTKTGVIPLPLYTMVLE